MEAKILFNELRQQLEKKTNKENILKTLGNVRKEAVGVIQNNPKDIWETLYVNTSLTNEEVVDILDTLEFTKTKHQAEIYIPYCSKMNSEGDPDFSFCIMRIANEDETGFIYIITLLGSDSLVLFQYQSSIQEGLFNPDIPNKEPIPINPNKYASESEITIDDVTLKVGDQNEKIAKLFSINHPFTEKEELTDIQPKLEAGEGIEIRGNTISTSKEIINISPYVDPGALMTVLPASVSKEIFTKVDKAITNKETLYLKYITGELNINNLPLNSWTISNDGGIGLIYTCRQKIQLFTLDNSVVELNIGILTRDSKEDNENQYITLITQEVSSNIATPHKYNLTYYLPSAGGEVNELGIEFGNYNPTQYDRIYYFENDRGSGKSLALYPTDYSLGSGDYSVDWGQVFYFNGYKLVFNFTYKKIFVYKDNQPYTVTQEFVNTLNNYLNYCYATQTED